MNKIQNGILIVAAIIIGALTAGCGLLDEPSEPSGPTKGLVLEAQMINTSIDTETLAAPTGTAVAFQGAAYVINSHQEAIDSLGSDFIAANKAYTEVDYDTQSLLVWNITVPQYYNHAQLNYVKSYMDSPNVYKMDASFMSIKGGGPKGLMTVRIGAVTRQKIKKHSRILTGYHVYEK